jgi:hypothetical protein
MRAPFWQLYQLLIHSPHIISYIRELHVIVISDTRHLYSLYGEWLFNDETFPLLLRTLRSSLQSFSLVTREHELEWACFPPKLQSSLLDLFISPKLTSVRLINICTNRFPIEALGKLKQLKRLGIVSCSDRGCWREPGPLPQPSQDFPIEKTHLESLELGKHISNCVIRSLMHPDSLLDLSHLRTVSLASKAWSTFVAVLTVESQQVIQEFQGIESLMWLDSKFDNTCVVFRTSEFSILICDIFSTFGEPFVPFEMGMFPRLRFLGFCIRGVENRDGCTDLLKVTKMLKNGAIPTTLEELTIIVESESYSAGFVFNDRNKYGDIVGVSDICRFFGRSGFDAVLAAESRAYQNVRRVNIFIDTEKKRRDDCEALRSLLPQELPLLAEKGILFGSICDKNEVLSGVSLFLPEH